MSAPTSTNAAAPSGTTTAGTRGTTLRLALLAGGLFVVGSNSLVIAGVLPAITASFAVPTATVALSITWYSLVVAVAAPVVAVVFARVSRTTLLAAGLAIAAAGTLMAALSPTVEWFTVARIVTALGGAIIVPTATAAAPSLVPPEQRGRALGATTLGFTLASVLGTPAGTALSNVAGWRWTLGVLAAIAVLLIVPTIVAIRAVPAPPALGFAARFSVLANWRVVAVLITAAVMFGSFNLVYIFSSTVAEGATGGDTSRLAVLLFAYGIAGVAGNWLAGRLADRLGSRSIVTVGLAVQALCFVAFALGARETLPVAIAVFALWGVVSYGLPVPFQHRIVTAAPAHAGIGLSWYSTAMYLGISLAPVMGALVLPAGVIALLVAAAAGGLTALLVFQTGYLPGRRTTPTDSVAD